MTFFPQGDIIHFVPGALAQLVEHIVHIDGVTGSSPVSTTTSSAELRIFSGALAQLVARLNGIQKVRGSTPLCSTKTTQLCGFFCCLYTVFHLFPQVPTHCEYRLPYRKLSSVLASALNFTSYTIIKNQALCVMQLLSASKAHSKRLIFLSNN